MFTTPGHAQESGDRAIPLPTPSAESGGGRIFTPAEFARFAPRNAHDMLEQVPGFDIRGGDPQRGLGQATENVLVNGQRITAPGGAAAELERTPADRVERIEIVDAASLNIAGLAGLVANVVTRRASTGSGQFSWAPRFSASFAAPRFTRGDISYSSRIGTVAYSLALANEAGREGEGGVTRIRDPSGGLIEIRDERFVRRTDDPELSANFSWDGPGTTVATMNLAYQIVREASDDLSERSRTGALPQFRTTVENEFERNFEIGGDLAFDLLGGRTKLIGLLALERERSASIAFTRAAAGAATEGDRVRSRTRTREVVGRAEYDWRWGESSFQVSAEGAFNSLERTDRLFELDAAGDFVAIPFPGGSGNVKEDRYEAVMAYGRPLGPGFDLQLAAGAEHSTLEAGGVARKFLRPKGSATLAWKPDEPTDISLKLSRVVEQLDFGDFLASVNLTDELDNAGNLDLVPPQSWELELELNRTLGAWGKSRLLVFGHLIQDIVDIIPVGANGESLGNLDSATRYGLEWQSTLQFDPLGWIGARLDGTLRFARSSVRDPLTRERRPISGELVRRIELELRHDIAESDWAWGANFSHEQHSATFRLAEVRTESLVPGELDVFLENKDVFGLTVRTRISNIADAPERRERLLFDGRRTEPLRSTERRSRRTGPKLSFVVRGSF